MLTGFDASPRALAKLANTTNQGNSEYNILGAVKKYGLIPYPLWPSPDDFDWNLYYQDIPQNILTQATFVDVKEIPADLNKSPLWTILRFPNGNQHGVCQINSTQYFDSEQGDEVKDLTYGGAVVISQSSLQVTLHTMNLVDDNGTFYIVGDIGKIGIADPSTLAKFQKVTSQTNNASTVGVPQVGVFKQVTVPLNPVVLVDN